MVILQYVDLRAGEYLARPDFPTTINYNAHASDRVSLIEHIGPVAGRIVPLLCHCIGVTGSKIVEDIFSTCIHAGNIRPYSISSGIKIIVTERSCCRHILGMLPAKPVNI
jgi:hypothetical protein